VTIGLGAMMRGTATLFFTGIPGGIPLPVATEPLLLNGLPVSPEKLVAAATAAAAIAVLTWLYHYSRTGIALRAIADDQQAAMSAGIDLHHHFTLTWALTGVICVVAGTLWIVVAGGGLGVVLLGLRVFPIVIIGGLDSVAGAIVGALVVGVLESLAAGYLDPLLGGGFSTIASFLVLIAALLVRPYGLFGRADARRV
jgi:branched-chain amino acid transport system permease protein